MNNPNYVLIAALLICLAAIYGLYQSQQSALNDIGRLRSVIIEADNHLENGDVENARTVLGSARADLDHQEDY